MDGNKDIHIEGNVEGGNINFGNQNFFSSVNFDAFQSSNELEGVTVDDIILAFDSVTSRLKNIRGTFADTKISIKRNDVKNVVDWILQRVDEQEETRHKLALVVGNPGQGKSVFMQQLAEAIKNSGYTVLGIKADDLSSIRQSLLSLDDLRQLLQLPASIEQCVRIVSDQKNLCIVLIDQLDTLALTLNTDEQSLRVIVSLIDRLREIPNVKIVVACRDFERQNDPVLSGIRIDQSFRVENLQEDEVNDVLQQINQPQLQELPNSLQHLLKTPLYLDIYTQIVLSDAPVELSQQLVTLQDLYGILWTLRIESLDPNAPTSEVRRKAVFHLVDRMQSQRKLKTHVSYLDDYPDARQYFLRTGFLQLDSHNLSFLHQTLFSYCYVRKFISDERSLSAEVFTSPQGFFERQLIIEVIRHLRFTNLDAYHTEINNLLFPPSDIRIRYHLRLLLLNWLEWQSDPTDIEYLFIRRIERANLDDFERWLRNLSTNQGWFQKFENDISRWLASDDNRVIDMAINYLHKTLDSQTEFVINQIKPFLDRDQEWNNRIAKIVTRIRNWEDSENALELLMHLVQKSEISIKYSSWTLRDMANSNVIAGCRLLQLQFESIFNAHKETLLDEANQYLMPSFFADVIASWETRQFLSSIATSNPQLALDYFLPWFVDTATAIAGSVEISNENYYASSWFFDNLHESPSIHNKDGISLVKAILEGLSHLARTEPTAFRKKVDELALLEIQIIQQLIICAFRANPEEYVEEIYEYLSNDYRRLHIQPDARLLVGATYAHSNQTLRNKWENLILSFSRISIADEEKSLEKWRRYFRYKQCDILDYLLSIDELLLSENARCKKQELLRLQDFENYKPSDGGGHVFGGTVQAPIPPNRQEKLSDDDWLRVLRKYNDETTWGKHRKRRHFLEGGVEELSRSLVEQVKLAPERFYRLLQSFDERVSISYVLAIIQGLAYSEAKISDDWVSNLVMRYHPQITGYSRIGVGDALTKLDPSNVPDEIINVMISWIQNDPNPDCDEERQKIPQILNDTISHSDGLINRAINSVRSSALEDVCQILFGKEPIPLEQIYEIIKRGSEDACASVKTIAIQQLVQWHNKSGDQSRAIELLETTLESHSILLTSHPIHHYLKWLIFVYPERALPYVQAMIEFPHEHTQHIAAWLISLAGLYEKKGFERLAHDLHLHENPAIRRGTAIIYAGQIGNPDKMMICCEILLILMNDEDEQVRIQTINCFRNLKGDNLMQLQNFFRQFFESQSLEHGAGYFIEFLTRSNLVTPEEQRLSLTLISELLEIVNVGIGDYRRGFSRLDREMTLYLRNLYDKTIDRQLREQIMDLFDEMLLHGSEEILKMLQGEDVEWLPRA